VPFQLAPGVPAVGRLGKWPVARSPSIDAMQFAKGHGTGNDFVIVPDLDGELDLTAELVRALCDRRFGIGADGVLRVVRAAAIGESQAAEWFMDYRNADGGSAEMCGNGVRVFVQYLIEEGLAVGPTVAVGTRAGIRAVHAEADGQFSVDMGLVVVLGEGAVEAGGQFLAGLAIGVGNPHLACVVDQPVEAIDLSSPRALGSAESAADVNIEVVRVIGPREVTMRVHERGSGLTLSCGTGAVAAAVAAAWSAGERPGEWRAAPWTVRVPGGRLAVALGATDSLLTGPAEIVARGRLEDGWLARRRRPAEIGFS
jgi:diaminopimelate epimerase